MLKSISKTLCIFQLAILPLMTFADSGSDLAAPRTKLDQLYDETLHYADLYSFENQGYIVGLTKEPPSTISIDVVYIPDFTNSEMRALKFTLAKAIESNREAIRKMILDQAKSHGWKWAIVKSGLTMPKKKIDK